MVTEGFEQYYKLNKNFMNPWNDVGKTVWDLCRRANQGTMEIAGENLNRAADQLKRMKRLGVQPSFLMNHVSFWGAAYRDQLFGPPRSERMDAAGDCVREGLPFTLHTDAPCSTLGTLRLIQTAVTRKCLTDGSVVNAAAQIGLAEKLGTLESGKLADLVLLDANPYTVSPDKIMSINVIETWVGGKPAFGA